MCSPLRHYDLEVDKKGRHIRSFSHARVDLVIGNISPPSRVRSHQHVDSDVMGFCLPLTSCSTGVQKASRMTV